MSHEIEVRKLTGQHYTLRTSALPSFEVFLAADQERPHKTVPASGLGIWQSCPSA